MQKTEFGRFCKRDGVLPEPFNNAKKTSNVSKAEFSRLRTELDGPARNLTIENLLKGMEFVLEWASI